MQRNIEENKNSFYIDETSAVTGPVVRWNSNDRIPFNDMLQDFATMGWISSEVVQNSNDTRKLEAAESLASYARNYKGPSDEERFEARAAFGAGAEVVNIITGHKWIA
jgi:hypothetical protein